MPTLWQNNMAINDPPDLWCIFYWKRWISIGYSQGMTGRLWGSCDTCGNSHWPNFKKLCRWSTPNTTVLLPLSQWFSIYPKLCGYNVGIRISEIAVPKNWDPTEPHICQELTSSEHLIRISSVCQFFLGHGSCWLRPRWKDHHAIKQRQESNESFAIGQAVVNGLLASIDTGDHDMGLWRIC